MNNKRNAKWRHDNKEWKNDLKLGARYSFILEKYLYHKRNYFIMICLLISRMALNRLIIAVIYISNFQHFSAHTHARTYLCTYPCHIHHFSACSHCIHIVVFITQVNNLIIKITMIRVSQNETMENLIRWNHEQKLNELKKKMKKKKKFNKTK